MASASDDEQSYENGEPAEPVAAVDRAARLGAHLVELDAPASVLVHLGVRQRLGHLHEKQLPSRKDTSARLRNEALVAVNELTAASLRHLNWAE